jgi:hypothetical protein
MNMAVLKKIQNCRLSKSSMKLDSPRTLLHHWTLPLLMEEVIAVEKMMLKLRKSKANGVQAIFKKGEYRAGEI